MGSTFNDSPNRGARKRSLTETLIHDFLSQMNQMVANEDLRAIGVSLENFHETYDTPEVQAYVIENPDESHEIDECVQKAQKLVDNWKKTLQEGDCIDIFWSQNARWYHSKVLSKQGNFIKVHYNGWSASFDEKIDVTNPSRFIYPQYTFTTEKRNRKSASTSDGIPNLASSSTHAMKGWANKFFIENDQTAINNESSTSTNSATPAKSAKKQHNSMSSSGSSSSSRNGNSGHDDDMDDEGCKIIRAPWSKVVSTYQKYFEDNFVQSTDRLKLRFISGQKVEVQGKQTAWFLISLIDSMAQRRTRVAKLGSAIQFNGHLIIGDSIKEAYDDVEVGDNIILHVVNNRKEWVNYDTLVNFVMQEIANSNPNSAERKKELLHNAIKILKDTGKTLSENIAIVVHDVLLEEN